MKIILRPHHLLCLQGYKGYNYNKIQKYNWGIITNLLQSNPELDIFIVKGKDDLCANCPAKLTPLKSNCIEKNVEELDKQVKSLIGIKEGEKYTYQNLLKKLHKIITPEIHEGICKNCAWWQKGLCRNSFKK